MSQNPERVPANIADFGYALMIMTIEIVSALSPNSKIAEQRLEDIAGRLLDLGAKMTDERTKLLVSTIAQKLIHTEEGASIHVLDGKSKCSPSV